MNTHALSKEEVVMRLAEAREQIRALGVLRIALFGSVVRGQAQPDSDVDLLVQFDSEKKTLTNFMELSFLQEVLQHRVELVTTEALSPFFGPHILREAEDVLHAA